MMDIPEWRARMQGTVSSMTVAAEVLSHGVSMTVAGDRGEVDPWVDMREAPGSRRGNGEPTNEGVGEVLNSSPLRREQFTRC